MPVSLIQPSEEDIYIPEDSFFGDLPEYRPLNRLSDSIGESMRLMSKIQALRKDLPGIDCGSCGAPNCRAFAEDIVMGNADRNECVIAYKDLIKKYIETYDGGEQHDG
jgi:ArsR family metal-binding transcriptional regulator